MDGKDVDAVSGGQQEEMKREETPENAGDSEEPVLAEVEDPADEAVAALSGELNLVKDQLLRTMADFDNYRKRVARDHDRMRQTAAESLMRDLLPVLYNLERAVNHATDEPSASFCQGIEMIVAQLRAALSRHGLKEIPAAGQPFNPHVHDALMEAESKKAPEGHVAEEFQKGYWLGDRVLRPSRVIVSKGPGPEADGAGAGGENRE